MGSFKNQFLHTYDYKDYNASDCELNDFFTRLNRWKLEYTLVQWDFYVSELARFQNLNQNDTTQNTQSDQPAAATATATDNNINNAHQPQQQADDNEPVYYEYKLPPVWKRLCAELIDFLILLVIKLYLTFMFVDIIHGDFDLQNYWDNPTSELVILEGIFRIVVCFYETYWLKGEHCATPGKQYMGLKVYRVRTVIPVQEHPHVVVRAEPCTELGWQDAIIRAVLKNTFVGLFMFPVCIGFLFVNQNRTGYDVISNSLVVEHNPNPPRHQAPM